LIAAGCLKIARPLPGNRDPGSLGPDQRPSPNEPRQNEPTEGNMKDVNNLAHPVNMCPRLFVGPLRSGVRRSVFAVQIYQPSENTPRSIVS
jgi:hypothetical protein